MMWKWGEKTMWTGNDFADIGAVKIGESLMTNTTLTELNLGGDDNIMKNRKNNIWRNESENEEI